jgi:predicted CXXCH cytochrome family protein
VRAKFLGIGLIVCLAQSVVLAQVTGDVLGMHDLSPGSRSPITAPGSLGCTFCHAPHSGLSTVPLWNQTLSKQTYTPYNSSTYKQQGNTQPPLGRSSSLCLSCHDGTIAVGQSAVYGKIPMSGSMNPSDVFGTNLKGSHPFSMVTPLKDSADLVATLATQGNTADPLKKVKLPNGTVECTSCHNPHVQGVDRVAQMFLVRDSSNGQLCLSCHDPSRVAPGQVNVLAGWQSSSHASASNRSAVEAHVGSYATVMQNACNSCHMSHNAQGPVRLLRAASPAAPPTMDAATQACMTCHNGGANLSPAIPNVFAEFAKGGHPFPAGTNTHDASETATLNNNRHATCVDCHNAHASSPATSFSLAPAIRSSQKNVTGISGADGVTVLSPAVNQFENCLRCHGISAGKVSNSAFGYLPPRVNSGGDPLNVIAQFGANAISSHPVMRDFSSPFPQPSILPYMKNLDGTTDGRLMGNHILCTDCHNSDDNREFGGSGPNGPHGSNWKHILERRYEFTQLPAGTPPGQTIPDGNLYKTPDLGPAGPYALCAKCHDLRNQILADTSFKQHSLHISKGGFSCSVCHSAHGVGQAGTVPGVGLVNFDTRVVGPRGATPISYNPTTNTCTLTCHGHSH